MTAYNCGCSLWMHGIEDACDLYLPERKPALSKCPMIAKRETTLRNRQQEIQRELAFAQRGRPYDIGLVNRTNQTAARALMLRQMVAQQAANRAYRAGAGHGFSAIYAGSRMIQAVAPLVGGWFSRGL